MPLFKPSDSSTQRSFWALPLFFLITLLVFSAHILSQKRLLSFDGFYHIAYARLYWERGLFLDFPWMHFSVAREYWADHHFLFHVLLIPFSWLDVIRGQQWAGIVFGSTALTVCAAYLRIHRVRHWWLFAVLLLFCSDYFLFRMMMARSMSLAVIWFVLALLCLERERYGWLALVAFGFMWSYQTSLLLLPLAGFAVVWRWQQSGRWNLLPLGAVGGGLVGGLLLNPFFPDTLSFLWFHLVSGHTLLQLQIGQEWDPVSFGDMMRLAYPAVMLGLVMPFALVLQTLVARKQGSPVGWNWWRETGLLWFLTWMMFGLTAFRAIRFLEYAPAFAILLGARLWPSLQLEQLPSRDTEVPAPPETNVAEPVEPALFSPSLGRLLRRVCQFALVSFLVVGIGFHVSIARRAFVIRPHVMVGAAKWLKKNTPKDSIVFHSHWTVFPILFAYNTRNRYISGLNPHFLQHWKPRLHRKYRRVSMGKEQAPVRVLQKDFQSSYVFLFTRGSDTKLWKQLQKSPAAQQVYKDRYTVVMKLLGTARKLPGQK